MYKAEAKLMTRYRTSTTQSGKQIYHFAAANASQNGKICDKRRFCDVFFRRI